MVLLAILLLVALPIAEIWVIVQVAHAIGVLPAVVALLLISAAGPGLVRRQGLGVWNRARDRVRAGEVPGRELVDAVLLLMAGLLITIPGFLTDALGLLLLLPAVRAVVRRLALGRMARLERAVARPEARRVGGLTVRARPEARSWPSDLGSAAVALPSPPVRDAATVMLVRDGPSGMEVFMLRRNLNSDFVGGAYVFPGGAVDEADRHTDLEAVCDGRTDAQASEMLGVDRGGLAFWVAAVRECFEEAGVLLATTAGGSNVLSFRDPAVAARFRAHRDAVNNGSLRLVDLCRAEGLGLDCRRIHYFSHWITPLGAPRRYDTRFFVAAAPPEQVPLHDDHETIAHLWLTPADALARTRRGELEMILPTIKNLEAIARFDRAADLLAAANAIEDVPTIQPRIVRDSGGARIVLPGDAGFPIDPEIPRT